MSIGSYRHKKRKVVKAARGGRAWKKLNVHIDIYRFHGHPTVRSGGFAAKACFFKGGTHAIEARVGTGRNVRPGRTSRMQTAGRLYDNRCSTAYGPSPTTAVKRALRILSGKKL